jgi:hypothetical protein
VLRITQTGTIVPDSADEVARLREQFDRQLHVRFPSLFEPALLQLIHDQIDQGTFQDRTHLTGAQDQWLPRDSKATALLNFLFNNSLLFSLIESVTGCGHVGSFRGNVYRFLPGTAHGDTWHSDMALHRIVAASVNLGTAAHNGGVLQIRDCRRGQILQEIANTGCGDAVVFRLADHLEHRVTGLDGPVPRIAFAGWFHSEPDFSSRLKSLAGSESGAG